MKLKVPTVYVYVRAPTYPCLRTSYLCTNTYLPKYKYQPTHVKVSTCLCTNAYMPMYGHLPTHVWELHIHAMYKYHPTYEPLYEFLPTHVPILTYLRTSRYLTYTCTRIYLQYICSGTYLLVCTNTYWYKLSCFNSALTRRSLHIKWSRWIQTWMYTVFNFICTTSYSVQSSVNTYLQCRDKLQIMLQLQK